MAQQHSHRGQGSEDRRSTHRQTPQPSLERVCLALLRVDLGTAVFVAVSEEPGIVGILEDPELGMNRGNEGEAWGRPARRDEILGSRMKFD